MNMVETRTIAWEQVGESGKEIYIIDMEMPFASEYSFLECTPVDGTPYWEYTKSKKRFIPTGRK